MIWWLDSTSSQRMPCAAQRGYRWRISAARVLRLGDRLHSRVAPADHDERQVLHPNVWVVEGLGDLEASQQAVPEVHRLEHSLEPDGVLG
jgi:hypothetical protein